MTVALILVGFFQKAWSIIDSWDKWLFLKINNQGSSPFLDAVCPLIRESNIWMPFYLFLLLFIIINFGWKSVPWILFFILTVALADQVSSNFLKNWVNRTRPGNDLLMQIFTIKRVSYYPKSGSFTSSHATNHFAMAMFIWLTLKPYLKKWGKLLFVWAAIICYAQVYVGVHYPIDVICGGLLGCLLGWATASFYNRRLGLQQKTIEPPIIAVE